MEKLNLKSLWEHAISCPIDWGIYPLFSPLIEELSMSSIMRESIDLVLTSQVQLNYFNKLLK